MLFRSVSQSRYNWFKDNIITFTSLSILMSMILAINEGFKRMLGHVFKGRYFSQHSDMGYISTRLPFVLIGSALAPLLFFKGFEAINWLTGAIIDTTKFQMAKGISELNFSSISWAEVVMFIGFDIALIGMMIPILLQNFRRWFDILALSMIAPLALSCSLS